MNAEKITDKIRKLLALSTSNNPNEAQAALLKARRLMAQHKLTEKDIADAKPSELNQAEYTEMTFSGLRNTWLPELAHVIAENHCCAVAYRHAKKSTVNRVVFIGLGDDPFIACQIFDYAVESIVKWGQERKKSFKDYLIGTETASKYTARQINDATQRMIQKDVVNYAVGFSNGLKQKYAEQNIQQSDEMALMVVLPAQVTDYTSGLSPSKLKVRTCPEEAHIQRDGYKAGYNFSPTLELNAKAQ